jgi:hypothetical protein
MYAVQLTHEGILDVSDEYEKIGCILTASPEKKLRTHISLSRLSVVPAPSISIRHGKN